MGFLASSEAIFFINRYELLNVGVERYKLIMKTWRYIEQERHVLHEQIWPGTPYRRLASERRIRITHCIFTGHKVVSAEYSRRHLHMLEFCLNHGWNEKTPEEVFNQGWHFDSFENFLWQAINWDRMHIRCLNEVAE